MGKYAQGMTADYTYDWRLDPIAVEMRQFIDEWDMWLSSLTQTDLVTQEAA